MSDTNDMRELTERAGRLIDSIAGAILSTAEAASEKIALAAEVARIQTRMAALSAVLEGIQAHREAVQESLDAAPSEPLRELYRRQLAALAAQEVSVLERCGVPGTVAAVAVAGVDGAPDRVSVPVKRNGKGRFTEVNGSH